MDVIDDDDVGIAVELGVDVGIMLALCVDVGIELELDVGVGLDVTVIAALGLAAGVGLAMGHVSVDTSGNAGPDGQSGRYTDRYLRKWDIDMQ